MKQRLHLYYITAIIFCCCTQSIKAQKELEIKLAGLKKLSAISSTIDKYFESKKNAANGTLTKQDEKELKHWKRWEYFMSSRLDENGEIVNVSEKIFNLTQQYRIQQTDQPDLAYGNWSFIGPNSTGAGIGRVNRIEFHPTDPNIVYIGTARGGLWKSINGGLTWQCITPFLSSLGISGIVIDNINPNIIYILTGEGDANAGGFTENYGYISWSIGVLKSVDGGLNWNKVGEFPGVSNFFYTGYKLIQDPNNSAILFAATSRGLFKTGNGGLSWIQVNSLKCFDVEFKPGSSTVVYASVLSFTTPFIYSTQSGDADTWLTSNLPDLYFDHGRSAIAVSPASPAVVYLLTSSRTLDNYHAVYRSTNNGVNFTLMHSTPDLLISDPTDPGKGQAIYDLALAVSPTNSNDLVVGGINSWRSTNGGVSFIKSTVHGTSTLPPPLSNYVHADCHDLAYNPLDGALYNANDGGVWKSTSGGFSWFDLNDGLGITQFYHGVGTDALPNMVLGGTQDNGTKLRTSAGGSTFTHIIGADGFDAILNYNDPTIGFADANRKIYRLTGLGTTNTTDSVFDSPSFFPVLAMNPTVPTTIYAGAYYSCTNCPSINRSTNNGTTWTNIQGVASNWAIATCPSLSSRLYAAGFVRTGIDASGNEIKDGRMQRSDNGGTTWIDLTNNPGFASQASINGLTITDIGVEETNSSHVWVSLGGWRFGEKIYYSADGGLTWVNRSGSLPNIPINCIASDNANNIYIGTDIGVFYRGAASTDWTPFYNGLPQVPITDLIINATAGTIKAVTYGRGVWQSLVHSPCIPSLILSGSIAGNQFFEASGDISSTSVLTGGEGTKIGMKATNFVLLNVGFTASTQQEFKAYIGACGNGGVPFNILTDSSSQMEISSIAPPANGMKFPYGNLTTIENLGQTLNVSIRTAREGNQQLLFTDSKGTIIRKQNDLNISLGERTLEMEIGKNTPGTYYLFLFQDNTMIHFQEVIVK